MEQKSVVLARFPFSNQIDYKIRPAVILSNNRFNKSHSNFWVCPLTSKQSLEQFEIEVKEGDFSGKLETKSYIRSDVIATLENELILKEIGKVSNKLFKQLVLKIEENLK